MVLYLDVGHNVSGLPVSDHFDQLLPPAKIFLSFIEAEKYIGLSESSLPASFNYPSVVQ